jgi:hypothetical protein
LLTHPPPSAPLTGIFFYIAEVSFRSADRTSGVSQVSTPVPVVGADIDRNLRQALTYRHTEKLFHDTKL